MAAPEEDQQFPGTSKRSGKSHGARVGKVELARRISAAIRQRGLTQIDAAKMIGVDQPKISAVVAGHLIGFSIERLTEFLNRLGQDVEISVTPITGDARRGRTTVSRARGAARGPSVGADGQPPTTPSSRRSRLSSLFVDALDLTRWADRRDAQEDLPKLVRRLILSTDPAATQARFPSGEAIQLGGWDGRVSSTGGSAFVPSGNSVWELGVSNRPKKKADADYVKRTKTPGDVDPAQTAFIFVTPRRWSSKDAWVRAKTTDHQWREVHAYDADDLETWLELAPGIHAWLSTLLGKAPDGVQNFGTWWDVWARATLPAMSSDLVIAGRDAEAERVFDSLRDAARVLAIKAESEEEALAFLAASIQRLPQVDREALLARTLRINSPTAWTWAIAADRPLVLVAGFDGADATGAVERGHHVLLALGREHASDDNAITLPRVRREAAKAALSGMGFIEHRAEALASIARGSLLSLRRQLAVSSALERPDWARPEHVREVLPAILAGGWDESREGDRQILAVLDGGTYEDFLSRLMRWANSSDPPVRQVGTVWHLVSREDSWRLLPRLPMPDLRRFELTVLEVLGIIDPATELPPDRRWMAGALDRVHPVSGHLREGLLETAVLLGARTPDEPLATGQSGQVQADRIVHSVLTRANADSTGTRWASVAPFLPLLAEAAPDVFLDAIDASSDAVVLTLFTDKDGSSVAFGHSPHTNLLWALETLAWSPDYLSRASLQLARLARLDPGGRLSNRPARSLRHIFLLAHPDTAASGDVRRSALDALGERESRVHWRVLLDIVPRSQSITTPTAAPRWRDWKPEERPSLTYGELWQGVAAVVGRLLNDAGTDGNLWKDLVVLLPELPFDDRERVIEQLNQVDPRALGPDRQAVWGALRGTISHHRQFPGAKWAMPPKDVDALAEIYERLTPENLVDRYTWLFRSRVELPEGENEDWTRYQSTVALLQGNALRAVYAAEGLKGIGALAGASEQPIEVGKAVGRGDELSGDDVIAMFNLLRSTEPAQMWLGLGYVVARFATGGWAWADQCLEAYAADWTSDQRALFLLGPPASNSVFDWLCRFGLDTESSYWARVQIFAVDDLELCTYAANKFLDHERATSAVDLLAGCVSAHNLRPEPGLVLRALDDLGHQQRRESLNLGRLTYEVPSLLAYLDNTTGIDESRLAQLEWMYLPLLEDSRRPAKVLPRELARDPSFFVEVISWVFSGENEEPRELDDQGRIRAELGFSLLDNWRVVPGLTNDGDQLEEAALRAWVAEARLQLAASGHLKIGDQRIGHVLRYAPVDDDDIWPCRAVRDLIEQVGSSELELGLEVELNNSRGMTERGLIEGGDQERRLAEKYRAFATLAAGRWPRTARMLRRIAKGYAAEAQEHDLDAELTEDRWR